MEKGSLVKISGLPVGVYNDVFEYHSDFLIKMSDFGIKGGDINVEVSLFVGNVMSEIELRAKGQVVVECNRCGDDMHFEINYSDKMPIRVIEGGDEPDSTEDAVYIRKGDMFLNIDGYVEEMIRLAMPIAVCHEDDSMCNQEVIKVLRSYEENKETDSRWDALKELEN